MAHVYRMTKKIKPEKIKLALVRAGKTALVIWALIVAMVVCYSLFFAA